MVKDYALLSWIGANSFRTSHYPYSEPMLDLADRLGFLVIDETPAVGLFFRQDGLEKRSRLCRQYIQEMIARDKNHPSVIMWSLANEPHSTSPDARTFFEPLFAQARTLDPTRPVTLASFVGAAEAAFEFCDVVCLNRYLGWYSNSGNLDEAIPLLSAELDALHEKFPKPILLTEFGADALPGHHAQPPEMFSEEYQADLIVRYIELLRQKPYVVGEHVWNLCDFKTAQGITRAGALNHKGVFTRDRRPKLAAHRLRELWKQRVGATRQIAQALRFHKAGRPFPANPAIVSLLPFHSGPWQTLPPGVKLSQSSCLKVTSSMLSNIKEFLRIYGKVLALLLTMVVGSLLPQFHTFSYLVQYLLMAMLFFAFIDIEFHPHSFRKGILWVLLANVAIAFLAIGSFPLLIPPWHWRLSSPLLPPRPFLRR